MFVSEVTKQHGASVRATAFGTLVGARFRILVKYFNEDFPDPGAFNTFHEKTEFSVEKPNGTAHSRFRKR